MVDLERVGAERVTAVVSRQGSLLGLPEVPASAVERVRRGKAGRPPGARNKRSEDVARWVLAKLGDPLLHQAAVATMDVAELAARLGCTALEAVVEKRLAAVAVLPYLHQRRPLSVDLTNHRVVHLTITDGAVAHVAESVADQQVVEVVDVAV